MLCYVVKKDCILDQPYVLFISTPTDRGIRRPNQRENQKRDREIDGKRKTKRFEDREVEIGKIEGGKERERERERQREKAHEIPKQNLMDVLEGLCKITGIRLPPHGETALCR